MSNRWPDMFFSDKSLEQVPQRVAKKPSEVPAPKPPSEPTPPPSRSKLTKPPTPSGAWPNMFFGGEEAAPSAPPAPVNGGAAPPPRMTAPIQLDAKTAPSQEKPKSVDPFDTVAFEQFLDKGKKQQADERKAGASKIELPTKKDKDDSEAPAFVPVALPEAPVVPLAAEADAGPAFVEEKDTEIPAPFSAANETEEETPATLQADIPADLPVVEAAAPAEPEAKEAKEDDEDVDNFNQETIERAKDKGYEPMTLPPMPPGMEPPPGVAAKSAPLPYDEEATLPDLPPGVDAFNLAGDTPEIPAQETEDVAFKAEIPGAKDEPTIDGIDPALLEAGAAVVPGLPVDDPAKEDETEPMVPGLPEAPVAAEVPATLAATPPPAGLESANRFEPLEDGAKKFTLTNGEVITGKVLSENETELFVQTTTLGVVTLKKDHLAEKLMEVVLLNGDRVTGEIVAENKDFIYIRNASLGTLTIPRDQGAKNVVEAELANGNRIVGELVIETEDIVLIKSATLGTVSVDRKGMKHLAQRVEQSEIKSLL